MNPEQLKQMKLRLEEMKNRVIDAVSKVELDDNGGVKNTFAFFSFVDGQPEAPLSPGVEADLFGAIVEDFITFISLQEKEAKILKIQDEKLRARLLNNLHANLK